MILIMAILGFVAAWITKGFMKP